MEFVIVTHHKTVSSCQTGLDDMEILSIPDAFLVYTGCENKHQFAQSIVHISVGFNYVSQLMEHRYCSVNGTMIFRHPTSFRTAVLSFVSEKILLDTGQMYCINKINNIAWQDDDGVCEFIGILEAKIRLRIVKYAAILRNDVKYYAIAISDIRMNDRIKAPLQFLRCEFGVNVAYKEGDATRTRRSVLFPTTLINSEEILHNDLYSIITTKPNLTYVVSSLKHATAFGVAPMEKHVNFETFIAQYHTAREFARIQKEIVPTMTAMQAGDVITPTIEFATPRGRINYDVTIRNIGRSCMAVTFNETPNTIIGRVDSPRGKRRSRVAETTVNSNITLSGDWRGGTVE